MRTQYVLDLCSGGGGFILAEAICAERGDNSPRFQTVAVCDNNRSCQDVLNLRFPGIPVIQNIVDVTTETLQRLGLPPIDGICGGFPCQPHSVSGKKKGSQDDRDLWPEFRRILCDLRPKWAVLENVPGLFTTDSGRFLRGILGDLAELDFDAETGIVPCAYMESSDREFIGVGGVHLRERAWIIAYSNSIGCIDGSGVQRTNPDLLHEEWHSQENQQPGSQWLGGSEPIYSADDWGGGQSQSLPPSRNDGLPANLGGYLLRHDNLEEWLSAATVPSFSRQMRSSIELTPEEVRALPPEDREEYKKLKRAFDGVFDRAAKSLEEKSASKYRSITEEYSLQFKEYQELKKAMNCQLSIFGNAIVPQVGAIAFSVLKDRLARISVAEEVC